MKHRLGVSGSTIMSDPTKYNDLYWEGIEHIEIGEFPDKEALDLFLESCKEHQLTFGVHSPLYRNQCKYDLLQNVHFKPEQAWNQLENEIVLLKELGADYVLVHFPYYKEEVNYDVNQDIKNGLVRLRNLQEQYSIPIICEPKLGWNRSPAGIQYFHDSDIEFWEDIGICLDIGDFLMATEDQIMNYIEKWKDLIKVVHLHNVEFEKDNKYWWIPVHPSHESDGVHYGIEKILRYLAQSTPKIFVFEHTPHSQPSTEFVQQGYQWIKQLVANDDGVET